MKVSFQFSCKDPKYKPCRFGTFPGVLIWQNQPPGPILSFTCLPSLRPTSLVFDLQWTSVSLSACARALVRVAFDSSSSSTSRFRGFLELVARNWSAEISFPCEPLPLVLHVFLIFGFGFAIIKCCEFVVLEKEEEEDEGASTVL